MTEEVKKLIKSLYTSEINNEEFVKSYIGTRIPNEKDVLDLIQRGILVKDPGLIEEALVIIGTRVFAVNIFATVLCDLLHHTWHHKHEDIAMLLGEIKEPATVDCLFKATELKLEYLYYDDTYQFARKCIKALSAIGTKDAIEKLTVLSQSNVLKIGDYAKKQLRSKCLL